MAMDKRLLDILVCPVCKGKLVLKEAELWSRGAGLAFPIHDGIPRMIEGEARTLSSAELSSLKEERA